LHQRGPHLDQGIMRLLQLTVRHRQLPLLFLERGLHLVDRSGVLCRQGALVDEGVLHGH
jgi:hypothetical protein